MFDRFRRPYRELERRIGYRFRRRGLLDTALMHRSFRFENEDVDMDNQRLEFLGDAALGLVAAAVLFERFPGRPEGELTCLRSGVTSGKALARIGQRIDLGLFLKIGKGEEMTGGRERASNIADAFEAVLGAAFLDGGLRAVDAIFRRLFLDEIAAVAKDSHVENPKGELQKLAQRRLRLEPVYRTVAERGPAHRRTFVVEVALDGACSGRGEGSSRKTAEMEAARAALEAWESRGRPRKKRS